MKINGPDQARPAGASKTAKAASGAGGFRLAGVGEDIEPAGAARVGGLAAATPLDALLALQSVEDPLQRRRRAVGRAGRILDALDRLKLGLLEGVASQPALESLVQAVHEERGATDDLRLQGLLNEIETRAAVELAKLGRVEPA